MQSPYKKIIVYDLETGGLYPKWNSITEIAMVVIDLETLTIENEKSIMIKPYLQLSIREENLLREAMSIFKFLKQKEESTGLNVLEYSEVKMTLKKLDGLRKDIEIMYQYLQENGNLIDSQGIKDLKKDPKYSNIVELYFKKCYHPQALETTHISREMLEEEGVEYHDAFRQIKEFIQYHQVGNSLPIMAGHNIGSLQRRLIRGFEKQPDGFDNLFMEKLFKDNDDDFFSIINKDIIDTLKMARFRWYELPSYSLVSCASEVGLTITEAHRALPDTIANANFLIKMLKNLRGEGLQKTKYERRKFNFNF